MAVPREFHETLKKYEYNKSHFCELFTTFELAIIVEMTLIVL
jgi:hypothetical protein